MDALDEEFLDYEIKRTILNDLEEEDRRVKIRLKNGEEITGRADIIVWEDVDPEDDDCMDEYEELRFLPDGETGGIYLTAEEIVSFEVIGS